jgi:hypothetical protein
MSSFGRKLRTRSKRPKPWREGKLIWEPASHARTQEIICDALLRGHAEQQAKGRYTHAKAVMLFELDDVLELFGPPPHGMPITKQDLVDYLKRVKSLKLELTDDELAEYAKRKLNEENLS